MNAAPCRGKLATGILTAFPSYTGGLLVFRGQPASLFLRSVLLPGSWGEDSLVPMVSKP